MPPPCSLSHGQQGENANLKQQSGHIWDSGKITTSHLTSGNTYLMGLWSQASFTSNWIWNVSFINYGPVAGKTDSKAGRPWVSLSSISCLSTWNRSFSVVYRDVWVASWPKPKILSLRLQNRTLQTDLRDVRLVMASPTWWAMLGWTQRLYCLCV